MTVNVRDFRPEDADGWEAVRRAALPFLLSAPGQWAYDLASSPPQQHLRLLVAEERGEVIGTAQVGIAYDSTRPGQGFCNVYTHPDRLRRGSGSALVRVAEAHLVGLGAVEILSWVLDDPAGRAFARERGYEPSRSAHFLSLDLAKGGLPPRRELPPGVELRTAEDFADDPRPLFELDAEVTADEPSDAPAVLTDYARWLDTTWRHPVFDRALTSVVLVDGEVAAFSLATTDGATRYGSGMTGTKRAHRGRGLAKIAKNDSLHRARDAGFTVAYTGNDAGNGPMLAINAWFGYQVCATEVRHVRTLDTAR
ncbi:GNAT family N-acetyltransferase [Streptomyces sp. NBC_00102]|uniref:GNAT family N-acetyltransferase n=1 Tax=Streptomyces sp. NBC_00102 TaxID=2975652 RepID=UPI002253E010|nr:GNAT family N-acetyltransferase [Streptomyces sp. NBC_00102]MCX5396130.1 GNAT family N-acetyltransferase [Streptomyces sp. NBC_00102]